MAGRAITSESGNPKQRIPYTAIIDQVGLIYS
jgi:hypothetical protein